MDLLISELTNAFPGLLAAFGVTLGCAVFAAVIALLLGIPTGFGRLSRVRLIRAISTFYVETIRGTPLLLQLFVWYYGVSLLLLTLFSLNIDTAIYNLLTALNSNSIFPANGISNLFFGVVGLGFNYGAYVAEVIRGGIQAVDPGQIEASEAFGFSRGQAARFVILPQALRIMTPAMTNNLITLVQDTSFLLFLGVADLALVSQDHAQSISSPTIRWGFYTVELLMYFAICYSLAVLSRRIERRNAHTMAGAH